MHSADVNEPLGMNVHEPQQNLFMTETRANQEKSIKSELLDPIVM